MLNTGLGLYLAILAFMLVSLTWCRKYWNKHLHPPLPPGPPTLPILGSILSLKDPAQPWLDFNTWRSTYGDIIYARLLSKPIVVINSEEVVKDLFELRSTIYSDRPQSIVFKPFALDFSAAFMPYGDRWRLHRRIFHQSFREAMIPSYHAELLRSTHKMLFDFLQDPTNYNSHFHTFIASFILQIVYDYEQKTEDDHIVHAMRNYMELSGVALGTSATMVMETFPFLLRLPVWLPGATLKRESVKCLQAANDMKEIPFKYIKDKMLNGESPPCIVANIMNSLNGFEDDAIETAIKEVASIAFGVANETTSGTLLVFLLAMVIHPDIQTKAQAEVDRVIGKDRLPDFNDRPALPYVEAILRETLRWHPVTALGVPHATTTNDAYNGYFIPKGITVIANIWAMTHDEKKYPNPDEFKPERFLNEDGSLTGYTMRLGFGFGRRLCVGRYLADAALWIAMASFFATFSVHKSLDERGEEIPVAPKFTIGITSYPEAFPCRIVPRFHNPSTECLAKLTGFAQSH